MVHRDGDRAQAPAGAEEDEGLGAVGKLPCDRVALLHPGCAQAPRHGSDPARQFRGGEPVLRVGHLERAVPQAGRAQLRPVSARPTRRPACGSGGSPPGGAWDAGSPARSGRSPHTPHSPHQADGGDQEAAAGVPASGADRHHLGLLRHLALPTLAAELHARLVQEAVAVQAAPGQLPAGGVEGE